MRQGRIPSYRKLYTALLLTSIPWWLFKFSYSRSPAWSSPSRRCMVGQVEVTSPHPPSRSMRPAPTHRRPRSPAVGWRSGSTWSSRRRGLWSPLPSPRSWIHPPPRLGTPDIYFWPTNNLFNYVGITKMTPTL